VHRPVDASMFWARRTSSVRLFFCICWTVSDRFDTTGPFGGRSRRQFGRIAQLVEQLTLNQRVLGSSPSAPTNQIKTYIEEHVAQAKSLIHSIFGRPPLGTTRFC
jgi:hypothetical protein